MPRINAPLLQKTWRISPIHHHPGLTRSIALSIAIAFTAMPLLLGKAASSESLKRFAVFYEDGKEFSDAITREAPHGPKAPRAVSGIIVPHHLLVPDLIARGYLTGAHRTQPPDRIVVLFPDHFSKIRRPFATTTRGFDTVFGPVDTDKTVARALLARTDLFEASDLFDRDHGLRAHLPFIHHFFPGVRIVPIAIAIASRQAQWELLIDRLKNHISPRTLIIQSTDYSHFLHPGEAKRHDQETLNLIAAGDFAAIARLRQPQHMDSVGAHYIQARLQVDCFDARPLIVANQGSETFAIAPDKKTTSYIVAAYVPRRAQFALPVYSGQQLYYFAGDTLVGRNLTRGIAKRAVRNRLVSSIRAATGGHPLIINLEGVLLDDVPESARRLRLAMPADLATNLFESLGVKAAGIANNHAQDFGSQAFTEMAEHLGAAGITPLMHGQINDVGAFRIAALSDLRSSGNERTGLVSAADISEIRTSQASPPLFALVHWGEDHALKPAQRERKLAEALRHAGVSLIIGTHPHKASPRLKALAGGETLMVHSLGNFLFDQTGPDAGGALLEVRFFQRGTFAAHLLAIPNYYTTIVRSKP